MRIFGSERKSMGKVWKLCRLDVDIVVLLWEVTGCTGGFAGMRGRVFAISWRGLMLLYSDAVGWARSYVPSKMLFPQRSIGAGWERVTERR